MKIVKSNVSWGKNCWKASQFWSNIYIYKNIYKHNSCIYSVGLYRTIAQSSLPCSIKSFEVFWCGFGAALFVFTIIYYNAPWGKLQETSFNSLIFIDTTTVYYNSAIRITTKLLTPLTLCVLIFLREWFKSRLRTTDFWEAYIKSTERNSPKIYFFIFRFVGDVKPRLHFC